MESLLAVINVIILQAVCTELHKLFCLWGTILANPTEMSLLCVFKTNQQTKRFLNAVLVFVWHLKCIFPSASSALVLLSLII